MDKHQNEMRVAVETENGQTVWLPASQVAAFEEGQKKLKQGQRPKNSEQRASRILSMLKESKE